MEVRNDYKIHYLKADGACEDITQLFIKSNVTDLPGKYSAVGSLQYL